MLRAVRLAYTRVARLHGSTWRAVAMIDRDPDAARPQSYRYKGHDYLGFQRYGERYLPFWALPRYSSTLLCATALRAT